MDGIEEGPKCECNMVDIGVGNLREPNTLCPVHGKFDSTLPAFILRDDDDFDDEPYCQRCDGTGLIMTCCDDMCRGAGECIHGDGEKICPECHGRNAI